MKVAITGASGFVGNRIVEKFYLGGIHEVTPLLRGTWGLALPARFDLPWKVCDHFDVNELSRAFAGCEAVVHAAIGSPFTEMAKAVYLAADRAGVRRVVVLSSASVYNQNPAPGTTEESPLPEKSAFRYNSEKIAADRVFRRLRSRGRAEVVFLMPGIVYGPRSRWVSDLAAKVIEGTAHLIRGGEGICNAVYVDNLVEAIRLSLHAPGADGEAFFVSDAETVMWRDFYAPVVSALGATLEELQAVEEPPAFAGASVGARVRERMLITAESKRVRAIKPYVPAALKKVYKAVVTLPSSNRRAAPNPWEPLVRRQPEVSPETILLQQCVYKLPNTKAERVLNYVPPVAFAEGMRRSVAWLEFAGYPVVSPPPSR